MIINKHGAFQISKKIRLTPFRHHLNRSSWRVFVWDADYGVETNFAVFASDNAEAAEIGYSSHLIYLQSLKEVREDFECQKQEKLEKQNHLGESNE